MLDLKVLRLNYNPPYMEELGYDRIFETVDEVTVHTSLMQTISRYIFVADVRWKNEIDLSILDELDVVGTAEEITREKNVSTMMISGKLPEHYSSVINEFFQTFNCFIEFPAKFTRETLTGSIVGTQEDLNRFLDFAREWGAEYEILSIRKYHPKMEGALKALTHRQYLCMEQAYRMGYFDSPRKVDSRRLAKAIGISHSTLLEHLRKGERTIFSILFSEY